MSLPEHSTVAMWDIAIARACRVIKQSLDAQGIGADVLADHEARNVIRHLEGIARTYGLREDTFTGSLPLLPGSPLDHYLAAAMIFRLNYGSSLEGCMRQICPQDFRVGDPLQSWWGPNSNIRQEFFVAEDTVVVFSMLLITPRTLSFDPSVTIAWTLEAKSLPHMNIISYPHPLNPSLYLGNLPNPVLLRGDHILGVRIAASPCTIAPIGVTFSRNAWQWRPPPPFQPLPQPDLSLVTKRLEKLEEKVKTLEEGPPIPPRIKALIESMKPEET